MILRFGNYRHDDNEVRLSIDRRAELTAAKVPYVWTTRWTLDGLLVGDDVADITTKINALEAAYKVRGVDAELLTSEGGVTAHRMLSAASVGGIRVIGPPSYPDGSGAEYTTWRRYSITIEADFPVNPNDPSTQILDWNEVYETSGGGPLYGYTQPIKGSPIRQTIREQTTYKATQSGSAVGYLARPTPPAPIWPGALIEQPRIMKVSPKRNGSGFQEFAISWSYQFEAPFPLNGTPTPQLS
jgi:hypothetical protein